MDALDDAYPLSWQAALAAKTEHVNASAGTDRSEESGKGCGRRSISAAGWGLVGLDIIRSDMGVYSCAAWEVDD